MKKDYPVSLRLAGKLCVVVGGGKVAARKLRGLLECGARIKLISPQLDKQTEKLVAGNKIPYLPRKYRKTDLKDAFLVIGATDDMAANKALSEEAERQGCLVNIVDQPDLCNVTMPALVRQGELTLAISTGGGGPALAKYLKKVLAESVGPEYGKLVDLMRKLRPEVKQRFASEEARRRAWESIIASDVIALLREDKTREAEQRALECLSSLSE